MLYFEHDPHIKIEYLRSVCTEHVGPGGNASDLCSGGRLL
jgi:hypothetical protein